MFLKENVNYYIPKSAHYKEVFSRVQFVKQSLWIGTADIKDLYVEEVKNKKPQA
jgi:hypothetical protein